MEGFNFVINIPAALKHLSASSEDGGNVSRRFFILLRAFGHFLWLQKTSFLDMIQNIWGLNVC